MIVLEAQKGTIENCKIKAPSSFLMLLVPLPPLFNVGLAPVQFEHTTSAIEQLKDPSGESTLSFGGGGFFFAEPGL